MSPMMFLKGSEPLMGKRFRLVAPINRNKNLWILIKAKKRQLLKLFKSLNKKIKSDLNLNQS